MKHEAFLEINSFKHTLINVNYKTVRGSHFGYITRNGFLNDLRTSLLFINYSTDNSTKYGKLLISYYFKL